MKAVSATGHSVTMKDVSLIHTCTEICESSYVFKLKNIRILNLNKDNFSLGVFLQQIHKGLGKETEILVYF